ncbi:ABC transporter permease [Porphyromonas pogonae]|uniref:ABC transporter permease n=1 Tax=Porphyromonas pogonae TaxID=867595 RepID=UPI002E7A7C90|nr:ABC transporter permease [Porphyromonas pogonae]
MFINRDSIQEITATLRTNKLRTLLTGFSVGWGVLLLVILLSAGTGVRNAAQNNIDKSGQNDASAELNAGYTSKVYKGFDKWRMVKLTVEDCEFLQKNNPEIKEMSPFKEKWNCKIAYKDKSIMTPIMGVNEQYSKIRKLTFISDNSRYINIGDINGNSKVVILNSSIAKELFSDEKEVSGKIITIDSIGFKVIGVFEGKNQWDKNIIPLSTMVQLKFDRKNPNIMDGMHFICYNLDDNNKNKALSEKIRKQLYHKLYFDPNDEYVMNIDSQAESLKSMNKIMEGLNTFLWIIGLSTLAIGIIGIINIMQISVTERQREIGIRKALGAKPRDIISMILQESIFVTFISGLIGLIIGVGIMYIVSNIMMQTGAGAASGAESEEMKFSLLLDPVITLQTALATLAVMIGSGVIAGYLPVKKALKIPTVEAMRN